MQRFVRQGTTRLQARFGMEATVLGSGRSPEVLGPDRLPFGEDPVAFESPRGFWSRVIAPYGYNTGRWLFPLCGFSTKWAGDIDEEHRAERIAYVLHVAVDEWLNLCYRPLPTTGLDRQRQRRFCGGTISAGHLSLMRPRVCPACLRERCIWWAVWDLTLLVSCPIHGIMLIDTCAACGRTLSWRPAPDRCVCGQDLRELKTVVAPARLVSLSAAIYAAIGFEPAGFAGKSMRGHLLEDIYHLELNSQLSLVRFLAATDPKPVSRADGERTSLSTTVKVADAAARVLEDWPNKLWQNLEHRIPATVSRSGDLSPRVIFGPLYWRMLRDLPGDTFTFLRDAIDKFVIQRWGGPIYGGKGHFSTDLKDKLNWYTLAQAKLIAHKSFRGMKEIVRSGAVESKIIRDGKGNDRIYVSRQSLEELIEARQRYISYCEVKKILGLSNDRVLILVKAGLIGCLKTGPAGGKGSANRYLREDIAAIEKAFASNLGQSSDWKSFRAGTVLSLGEALTTGTVNSKAALPDMIRSVIGNRIRPVARLKNASGILGYLFRLEDLAQFKYTWTVKVAVPRGYMNYGESAALIGTNRQLIPKLIAGGHLAAAGIHSRSKLLDSAEVHRFADQYLPIATATKIWKVSFTRIVTFLKAASIPFLSIRTYRDEKLALFVPRDTGAKMSVDGLIPPSRAYGLPTRIRAT